MPRIPRFGTRTLENRFEVGSGCDGSDEATALRVGRVMALAEEGMGGWTGSADKVALFQLGSVPIGPRLQRRRLALMAAMMSSSVMDSGRGRWTGA